MPELSKETQIKLREELLKARPAPPPKVSEAEYTSQIEVSEKSVNVVLNGEQGSINEGTALKYLEDEGLDPTQYEVTKFKKSVWGPADSPMDSVRFEFAKITAGGAPANLPDLDDLHQDVKRNLNKKRRIDSDFAVDENSTLTISLADTQTGKGSDVLGGTKEMLERMELSLEAARLYVEEHRPAEIVIMDVGDSVEQFESVAVEERTNDLQMTEQIRVWRRVFWSWIDFAAGVCKDVKVLGVPSNHGRVRRGKNNLGPMHDDWGIEVLAQVSDMASIYPERYSHVKFYSPDDNETSLSLKLVGGKVIGLAHGDQAKSPAGIPTWWQGQALGRKPIGSADILFVGHFHHFAINTFGDGRWLFICPAADSGSSWYTNISGNSSKPGVLLVTIDSKGWRDIAIC